MSLGSDDKVVLLMVVLQLIPILVRLVRLIKPAAIWEVYVFCGTSVGGMALTAPMIDCGSYYYTAFVLGDVVLQAILLMFPLAFIVLWASYKMRRT